MAYFKVSQTKNDGFSTISKGQNFILGQIETSISVKVARHFVGKIQMWLKSVQIEFDF